MSNSTLLAQANLTEIEKSASSTETGWGKSETDTQATARDLYERGLNVFPLPSVHDWLLRARNGQVTKHPYPVKMQRVYASRLYLGTGFTLLFDHSNIGVVCGRTSGNLVAIDCDSRRSFEFVDQELAKRSLPFWAFTSYRGGVYLMRLIEGQARNVPAKASRIPDVEVWGHSHYVVLPPSIHPSGEMYQWKSPEPRFCLPPRESIQPVSIADLEWLDVSLISGAGNHSTAEHALPYWARNLSRANIEVWMHGAQEGRRNSALTSLAYDLAGNEVAEGTATQVVLDTAARCAPSYSEREARAIVKSAYKKKRTPARGALRGTATHVKKRQAAAKFAECFKWNSRQWMYEMKNKKTGTITRLRVRANSVRRVFLALIERAKMDGRPTFRATIREISVIAVLEKSTVSHALQALTSAGFVRRTTAEDSSSLFSFVDYSGFDTLAINCRDSVSNPEGSKLPKTHAERDLFGAGHWHAVWLHLLVTPERNANQAAKALRLSPSVVYAAFEKLKRQGLITYSQAEGMYFGEACTDATLQTLALNLGRAGRSQAREERYRLERARYLNREFEKAKARYARETQMLRKMQRIH